MSARAGKLIAIVVFAAIAVYLFVYEPQVVKGLMRTVIRFGAFAGGLVFVALVGNSFWSAIKGKDDGLSAPSENSGSAGNRLSGVFLGALQAAIGISILAWATINFPG